MSSRRRKIALLLALAFSSVPCLAAEENVEEVLRTQTQAFFDAITYGKPDVPERLVDPRVAYVDESGAILSKKDLVDGAKGLPPGISGSIRVTEFHATVHGDVAVATHLEDEHENYHGHELHCQYRTTDTWKKTADGWRLIGGQVLAVRTDPPAMALDEDDLAEYCGRYTLTPEIAYEIRRAGPGLEGAQTGRKPEVLKAEAPDVLFVPGKPRYRKVFQRDKGGRITGFAERREAWDLVWTRVAGP